VRICALIVMLVGVSMTVGCVPPIPTPMPRRIHTPGGIVLTSVPDWSFIQISSTTVQDIRQKLANIDSGWPNTRFWVGRWTESTWGLSGDRVWSDHNLLVRFDDAGKVRSFRVLSNDDLLAELRSELRTNGLPQTSPWRLVADVARPISRDFGGKFDAAAQFVASNTSTPQDPHKEVEIRPEQVQQFWFCSSCGPEDSAPNPSFIRIQLKPRGTGKLTGVGLTGDFALIIQLLEYKEARRF
jgi:hypothetical protein